MTGTSIWNDIRYNEFELQIKRSPQVEAPTRKCFGIEWLESKPIIYLKTVPTQGLTTWA